MWPEVAGNAACPDGPSKLGASNQFRAQGDFAASESFGMAPKMAIARNIKKDKNKNRRCMGAPQERKQTRHTAEKRNLEIK